MKVRFAPESLRLRVSRRELEALLASASLVTAVEWPGGGWELRVVAAEAFGVDGEGGDLAVRLPRGELETLTTRLPCRDGLRYAFAGAAGSVEIRFEVDLHDSGSHPR